MKGPAGPFIVGDPLALDTKYRPSVYADVLGQEATASVLKQFLIEGKGFHQSYVFCGHHGSGKTTLGRILARALLCLSPRDGEPCDTCTSCRILLDGGFHECFEELDAASNSKKEDLERIVEEVNYSSFSGRRRVYLFDESHRLSKAALDILLKPLEDNISGSEEKRLVLIFCTTDPGKMSDTIFSRCAPAFVIRQVPPEKIAERLAQICDLEGIKYELDALVSIAELSDSHIRDSLKKVEGISMLGEVSKKTLKEFLQLSSNDVVLSILESLGTDLRQTIELATSLSRDLSPSSAYERIAEAALCAYRCHLGVGKTPFQWDSERIKGLSSRGPSLLGISARFAGPPHKPSPQTLILDLGSVHYGVSSNQSPGTISRIVVQESPQHQAESSPPTKDISFTPHSVSHTQGTGESSRSKISESKEAAKPVDAAHVSSGVWLDPRGIGGVVKGTSDQATTRSRNSEALDSNLFKNLLSHHLRGLIRGRDKR